MANLFTLGNFTLHSGAESGWKIDCDALADEDIKTLAEMIHLLVGEFSSVEGVPQGGLRTAEALLPHVYKGSLVAPHLIVDDVLTTGKSMEELRKKRERKIAGRRIINGAVIFARGQCPHWIKPLFQMPEALWTKPRTRSF